MNQVSDYNPRRILRQIALDSGTVKSVDQAVWQCVACNACGESCPRGISLIDVIQFVRRRSAENAQIPEALETPLLSLQTHGNPWQGNPARRHEWASGIHLPAVSTEHEYCLFTCCTSAYDPAS